MAISLTTPECTSCSSRQATISSRYQQQKKMYPASCTAQQRRLVSRHDSKPCTHRHPTSNVQKISPNRPGKRRYGIYGISAESVEPICICAMPIFIEIAIEDHHQLICPSTTRARLQVDDQLHLRHRHAHPAMPASDRRALARPCTPIAEEKKGKICRQKASARAGHQASSVAWALLPRVAATRR